ncbi:Hypothetical_protein [Hexamita inflata]|uniref:Hypothetical_protein n=1 Tax=Hexamita inflata TaxID=28002 RepID=A0AA86N9K9_9EUKA|nr:Hypothetical protein HINF_LOCUS2843 [Hexamita inflata]CAI9977094.1 Hypothetical protein HINF_LOCUS64739 [Hexamita inflata]
MYCVNENEIVLKTHKLRTIVESADESKYESPRVSRCSSQSSFDQCDEDNELELVQVTILIKLTNYSLQTVSHDISRVEFHCDVLERNIKRITNNSTKLMEQLEVQDEALE